MRARLLIPFSTQRSSSPQFSAVVLALLGVGCHTPPNPAPHSEPAPQLPLQAAVLPAVPQSSPRSAASSATPRGVDTPTPRAPAEAEEPAPPLLLPLPADAELVSLAVPQFAPAALALPRGAREPRPLVIAVHGNFDRPEWQCEVWRNVTRGYPFVLCPRGVRRSDAPRSLDRWTFASAAQLRRELDAAVAALQERYGAYVAAGPVVYIGFSLGAFMGVSLASAEPARFPRVVLVEGGHTWNPQRVREFAKNGGKRVLFACGQRACRADAAPAEKWLLREAISTKIVDAGQLGHTYDGEVAAQIARNWAWLVADDPRFGQP